MNHSSKRSLIETIVSSAIHRKTVTFFSVFLIVLMGIISFFSLGQLEDPYFTVKTAMVQTAYPGATAQEVEQEVSNLLSLYLQQIPEVLDIQTQNFNGLSIIKINIEEKFRSHQMPQIWDNLRQKVKMAQPYLPPGVGESQVFDSDFGEVYGHIFSLVAEDGFSYKELEDYGKKIKLHLSTIKEIARIELIGVQPQVIYIDLSQTRLASLKISPHTVLSVLQSQNLVVDSGSITSDLQRIPIRISGTFHKPQDIQELLIRPSEQDIKNAPHLENIGFLRLGDIAKIYSGYFEPAKSKHYVNGKPAIAIAISPVPGENIVSLSQRLEKELDHIKTALPHGLNIHKLAWQGDLIQTSIQDFLINLLQAILIVVLVLTLSMGWRMSVIISTGLILTILSTFIFMNIWGIDLHRVSLGALVIALGMMVDNAIVIAEGIYVRMEKGMDRLQAALEASNATAWPLLGATIIAILAFYPTFSAQSNVGEFCTELFSVIAISLGCSWLLSLTITPLQSLSFLKIAQEQSAKSKTRLLTIYEHMLSFSLRHPYRILGSLIGLLILSLFCMKYVEQMFFPVSSRPQFTIHYWADTDKNIDYVYKDLQQIQSIALENPNVVDVSTFIGAGAPRFYLPVTPETNAQNYGQIIINVRSSQQVQETYEALSQWINNNFTGYTSVQKYNVGPGDTWKFELLFIGSTDADPEILKSLAQQAFDILKKNPLAQLPRISWERPAPNLRITYNQYEGRMTNISRDDVSKSLQQLFDGKTVGYYREKDNLYPIIVRDQQSYSDNLNNLDSLQVQNSHSPIKVPLESVSSAVTLEYSDPIITNFDRQRSISIQTNPVDGVTFPTLYASVIQEINAIKVPPGYKIQWEGEKKNSQDSIGSLIPGIFPALIIMVFILIALFNAYRPTIIILLCLPFSLIGIIGSLLITNIAFGFMALLGAMSLVGMIIKNAIVLLDEIDSLNNTGLPPYEAVIQASVSRLRPVVLATATTVLGVLPLLKDVFWSGMGITIMGGLIVGTLITMLFIPVMYTLFYKIKIPPKEHKN